MDISGSPREIAYVLLRRWRLVLWFFVGCLALDAAYLGIASWKYESDALVMVKVNFNSRDLARAEFGSNGDSTPPMQVSDDVIKSLIVSYKTLLKNDAVEREVVSTLGVESLYPGLSGSWLVRNFFRGTPLDKAVEKFDGDIDVKQLKESNIISLVVFNKDPVMARRAADLLLSQFISLQQSVFRRPSTAFIGNQVQEAQKNSETDNHALMEFKQAHRLSSIPDEREQLLQERTDVAESLGTARSSLSGAQARQQAIAKSLREFSQTAGVGAGTDAMSRQLDDAQQRLTAAMESARSAHDKYTDSSPMARMADLAVTQARQRLTQINGEISSTVKSGASPVYQALQTDMLRAQAEVAQAGAQVKSLSMDLAAINARLQELSGAEGELTQLQSKAQVAQDNLTTQLQRIVESRISSDLNKSQITSLAVVQKPTLGYEPTRPRWLLTTALAVFMGLCGGVAAAFMFEVSGQTSGLPEQVERATGLPVLASLGAVPAGRS